MMRYVSYQALLEVLKKDRHAHLVLKEMNYELQEQRFVSALVYTVLQHKLFLEYQFDDFIDVRLPLEIRIILLMGAAQHYKMDAIPDYALVSESVELSKRVLKGRYTALVNAVLNKMIRRGERDLPEDEDERVAVLHSMPLWILKLLSAQYGKDFAFAYAEYCQEIKANYVRIRDENVDPSFFEKNTYGIVASGALFQSDLLETGRVIVQDINSQKVALGMELSPGLEVLDCCCGPGTKTVHIADLMENSGHIDGVELHPSRAKRTEELLERCAVSNATVITSDLLLYQTDKRYDRILLDAPCSGLGVLSHKHDLRYHIRPEDLDDLQKLQEKMLDHVAPLLKEAGILLYATCTLNKKENSQQIKAFLNRHPDFRLVDEETLDPIITKGDGFYIAKLKKMLK